MSLVPFDSLPDEARLWVFAASREPDATDTRLLLDSMRRFVGEWTAHRQDLAAGIDWREGRFLLIAVDESVAGASGCSIDALTGHLRRLGAELNLDLLDSAAVWLRDSARNIRALSRAEFSDMAARGEVTGSTMVFDLTLARLGDVRRGLLERTAGSAWHSSLLTPA